MWIPSEAMLRALEVHLYDGFMSFVFPFLEQTDGHNILSTLSTQQYRRILELMEDCILATDLMLFFPNRAKLEGLIQNDEFDWSVPEHR